MLACLFPPNKYAYYYHLFMSTINIQHSLQSRITLHNQEYDLNPLLQLLIAIHKHGNLRAAASSCCFSYRKAWNIIKDLEAVFGHPLVEKHRGKGSKLSMLGEKLLAIKNENDVAFNDQLKAADNKVNHSLQKLLSQSQTLRIIASDSEKLNALRLQNPDIDLHIDGSSQALSAYTDEKCDVAGFHIVSGNLYQQQLAMYAQYLDKEKDHFVLLERRQQGIISHPERPISTLQQILDQQLVFVNRQQGSGTRLLLDNLIKEQHINADQLIGYCHEEHTHLAVASMIISRQADAGLGIKSIANRLKLHFTPVCDELYFLVFRSKTPQIQLTLNILFNKDKLKIINYKEFVTLILNKT